MKQRTAIIIGASALILAGILTSLAMRWHRIILPAGQSSAPSSSQQEIDMNLSLAPSSTASSTNTPPATHPSTPPATTLNNGCDLQLAFTTTDDTTKTQGTMVYTLIAKNIGDVTCAGASISVYYASNESFFMATPQPTSDGYYWNIGTLAPSQQFNATLITNRVLQNGTGAVATNEACLSASNGADACANVGQTVAGEIIDNPASQKTAAATPITTTLAAQPNKELGIWLWTPITQMSPTDIQNTVQEVSANHFNAAYLTIDDYLALAALPDGSDKQQKIQAYENSLSNFIGMMQAKGIAVDAEAGWRDWGEAGADSGNAATILSFVASYNASDPNKFRGLQYDIEPYLLPQYDANEAGVLTDYVTLVDTIVAQDKSLNIPLTMDIPHFYDSAEQWTPQIPVDGITTYPYDHLLRILGELSGSRMIVLAYRNFAEGSDGSIGLAQQEITQADTTNVQVLVAQETGPVTPSYVTFHGKTIADLAGQVSQINQAFAGNPSFGGIAIDYLDPFLQLPTQ